MKFELIRIMQYTETAIIEADGYTEAIDIFNDESVEFETMNDDVVLDQHIKMRPDLETPEQTQIDAVKKTLKNRIV